MSQLLLFTNEYPYRTGDVVFVEKEIEALADRFDSVVVFCHARDTSAGMAELPAKVTFGGNLFEPAPEDRGIRALLNPWTMAALVMAALRELVGGRLLAHRRLFLMGALVGITQANRAAVKAAIAADPDTVAYAFWGMGGGLGLAWLRGVKRRVVRLHRYDLYESESPEGYLPFRRHLFARATKILVISEDGRRYLEETYRSKRISRKIELSRLGVFGPDRLEAKSRGAERLVVSCSMVTTVKRVDLLAAALKVLRTLSPDSPVQWVHFGSGPLFDQLEAAVADPPAGLTVDLRGQRPNSELLRFYQDNRVDAFVNVSASEGVPVSIMEAISYGIPVVATAVGGTPEIVAPELGSGRLVAADASPEEIANAIDDVLAHDADYDPRALWEREYDATLTGARAADLVRGVR